MEKGHVSIRRGVSWSPGGGRKTFQPMQGMDTHNISTNAPWETSRIQGQQTVCPDTNQLCRKTNLTRSASLSEKELKEARIRSQIIAAQLTIPTNSSSRGVQLFNRRRQRVNAFTLESCGGEGTPTVKVENEKAFSPCDELRWAESSSEEKDRELNNRNSATKSLWSPTARIHKVDDIMEDPGEQFHEVEQIEGSVTQERHFLPVNDGEVLEEEEEEKLRSEESRGRELAELEEKVDSAPASDKPYAALLGQAGEEGDIRGEDPELAPPDMLVNSCNRAHSDPEKVSVQSTKQPAIINRTARPFFSPSTVQATEAIPTSPVMDTPPAPSYATPPLPTFTASHRVVFSPPPPPPSYPTPPLPAFTNQPPQTYSSPTCMSPVMAPIQPAVSQFTAAAPPVSALSGPPVPQYGLPAVPRPHTFVPQPIEERTSVSAIKTGILEESAAKRTVRKSMFTFKEKPVVAPNPELLSLVQGVDEKKKHGNRPVPEPSTEEELLALGAEASNFLVKKQESSAGATPPEWASCLRTSRTRAREEHRPEQTLTNASGKGAELFAKRQSRMEKYVLQNQTARQTRSPSPTMSLPPSWVYPSNMPGRVKAIAKNSEISAQLTQTLQSQQTNRRKPSQKAPSPAPVPETPPLENGCTKIEMDLSRHQPYQLKSSLFILNPIKDPIGSLPRGAPAAKALIPTQPYSRQASLPISSTSHLNYQATHSASQPMSPQSHLSPTGGMDYLPNYGTAPAHGQPRITSPMSAVSPERAASSRSGIQAPRPTFSARKAGIEPQTKKEPSPVLTPNEAPALTRRPSLPRHLSSPEGPLPGVWSPGLPANKRSLTSPVSPQWGSRCQSPAVSQSTQPSAITPTSLSKPPQTFTVTSLLSPPWGSRCASPFGSQSSHPPSTSKPHCTSSTTSPVSPSRESRCMSPIVSSLDSKANHRLLAKNIINAAKRKNSPSPGALSGHSLPITPLGTSHHSFDCSKTPISPFEPRSLGVRSPTFISPPPTPTQRICSPVRLYNSRSLTDSDASVESEDSGLRSPGLRTYNTCPRGWGGSLRTKRGSMSTDL